ncbi:MAG: tetratricopeptide repeat protein [Desulfovibrio sp.]|nr:tetratricopeptide repeat protein [Desulfovibrio sp.]
MSQEALSQIRTLIAERNFDQAEASLRGLLPALDGAEKIYGLDLLGDILRKTQRLEEACALGQQELQCARTLYASETLALANVLHNVAMTLDCAGKFAEAIPYAEEEVAILRKTLKDDDKRLADALLALAKHHYEQGHFALARDMLDDCLLRYSKISGRKSLGVSACLNNQGRILENLGENEAAIPLYAEACAIRQELLGTHEDTAFTLLNYGTALAALGRYREAAEQLLACKDMYLALGLEDSPYLQAARDNLMLCWNKVCTPC